MMTPVEFKNSCSETIAFVQKVIDKSQINLSIDWLTEDDFASLTKHRTSVLNWINYFQHYLHEESFTVAFKLRGSNAIDGAFLAIYSQQDKHLHVFLIESLVKDVAEHPLKGRLISLTVIAITDLLAGIDDSVGAYIIQPDPDLIEHYNKFSFTHLPDDNVMHADFATLTHVQKTIMLRSNLRVDW